MSNTQSKTKTISSSPAKSVCIVGASRTGTNMLAGIFAAHGFFFGKCRPADDRNPKGYYENLAIYKGRKDVLQLLTEQGRHCADTKVDLVGLG